MLQHIATTTVCMRGSQSRNGKHGGKILLRGTTLDLQQQESVHEKKKEKERERDGGHRVDKAVLFLIYVLL